MLFAPTTNAASLHVEANEMPIALRHIRLSMQYVVKALSNPTNLTRQLLATLRFDQRFDRTTAIRPLGIRIKDHLQAAAINVAVLDNHRLSTRPPWHLITPLVDFSQAKHTKSTSPDTFSALYRELKAKYIDTEFIFTDGSNNLALP